MESTKRPAGSSIADSKRQKLEVTIIDTSNSSIIHFEDLPNEIIYSIFELLDSFDVYATFSNLNKRFQYLLIGSILPIKIDLSSLSKSAFRRYYKQIIIPYQLQTKSIRLTNLFIYDHDFSPLRLVTILTRLEKLITHNIKSVYLEKLLKFLRILPKLYLLDIETIDEIQNPNSIYHDIFHLPVLNFCKLSFKIRPKADSLPIITTVYSSIEHLIIQHSIEFEQLNTFLSFVPQLRYLSCHNIYKSKNGQIRGQSILLNNLTHVSLKMRHTTFNRFKQWITNLCHQIQVLRISTKYDMTYLDSNQWEELIKMHLPCLRIFDFQHTYSVHKEIKEIRYSSFTSAFWLERKWSFAHLHDWKKNWDNRIFYSTNPYRRKYYTLYGETMNNIRSSDEKIPLITVHHVRIQSLRGIKNCIHYFPSTTKITFDDVSDLPDDSIVTNLNCIISLKQLTKLVVNCHCFSFEQVIELLRSTPNLYILILKSIQINPTNYLSIRQRESFQIVSSINRITNVTIEEACTLDETLLLVVLCPRLEHLTINISTDLFKATLRFLLSETNQHIRRLYSLCITHVRQNLVAISKRVIESEKLFKNYLIKFIEDKLYLWG